MSCLIVTCADAKYFDWVSGTIQSCVDHLSRDRFRIGFLDLGCSAEQLTWIRARVDHIAEPQWHFDFDREGCPAHVRGLLARPFLRDYFRGYSTYLWIDADAWVQDAAAIDLLVRGANGKGLAIVPEIDRGSMRQYGQLPDYWKLTYRWYNDAYGQEIAHRLCHYPMLNAGVFALHGEAPHWSAWETAMQSGLHNSRSMIDQIALNVVVYTQGLFANTEMLPAWCNWTCHNGFPHWDSSHECLVEPYLPRQKIGICHLSNREKKVERDIWNVDGSKTRLQMMYPAGPISSER